METIGKFLSAASAGLMFIASALVILLVCHVTLDVTMRYAFNAPLNATILFVSTYYMVAITFLPLAAAEARDAQISVELVSGLLPSRVERILIAFGLVLTFLVMALLAMRGWEVAMSQYARGAFAMESRVRISTWQSYFFLPIGFGMIVLVALYKLAGIILGRNNALLRFLNVGEPGAPILEDQSRD